MRENTIRPPVVYLGPSLPHAAAAAVLPGADLRGPIRRGDLYRDREEGASVFVVLDGVFLQQEAVSPREIVDIVKDNGMVVGAASMGALRAAECWPAGMAGVGTIYRLFRRGSLRSDDEVAVTFAAAGPNDSGGSTPASVALVNVRHAAGRAVRQGWMDRDLALRLVRVAEETYFPERQWPDLLARAGAPPDLEPRLAACDLKKADALRALRRVGRWLEADPSLISRPRQQEAPFARSEHGRERALDVLAGNDPAEVRRGLARWHLLSGRGSRHLLAVATAHPGLGFAARLRSKEAFGPLLATLRPPLEGFGVQEARLDAAFGLRLALFEQWLDLLMAKEEAFAAALWAELTLAGELEGEILRWRAVREAVAMARERGLAARDRDRYLAEAEIANAHGLPSWHELRQAVRHTACPWPPFVAYRDELALAKRLREALFNPLETPGETPARP